MSAVATRKAPATHRQADLAEPGASRLFEPQGPTLEDSILATWHQLASADHATCPVCAGEMTRGNGCEACGADLA
jgi:hypothetical protein